MIGASKRTVSRFQHLARDRFLYRPGRRCLLGSFSGFFDTSGTENDGTMLTVAGLISEADDWDHYDSEWLAYLALEKVDSFRMHNFAHFKGPFASGWEGNEPRRQALIDRLTILTTESVYKVWARSIDLRDYDRVNAEYELTETIGGAYAVATANCVINAIEWGMQEREGSDRIHFMVEKGDIGQAGFTRLMEEKLSSFASLVSLHAKKDPLTGEEITPFHAADFVAYEIRRHHVGVQGGADPDKMREPLNLIRKALHPHVGIVTEKEIRQLCADGKVPRRQ